MRKLKILSGLGCLLLFGPSLIAQPTFPENGTADPRHGYYAFTHATIVKDGTSSITDGTLVMKNGKIVLLNEKIRHYPSKK